MKMPPVKKRPRWLASPSPAVLAVVGVVTALAVGLGVRTVGAAAIGVSGTLARAGTRVQARSNWDGIYTEAQARRGAPLYETSCAECHGSDLAGLEMAPGLLGGEFAWNWNGLTMGDLFERVRVSMPQADPRSVSRADKADILAYLLAANGFPAGDDELGSRTSGLRGVSFLAEQP
jgi:S-disulfanyl-L-cysteine oxidoreductase SoxD